MRVALTRRTDITNFDDVNRFIALLVKLITLLRMLLVIVSKK